MADWRTRGEARAQPFARYDETALQRMLDGMDARMRRLNDEYLRMMGEHIKDIGKMWSSDVHRLVQIRRMNKNLRNLQRRIGAAAGKTEREIGEIFEQVAQEDVRMARKILGVADAGSVSDNLPLVRILRAQARETAGRMRNLANTTVVSGPYRKAVDAAVSAVQSGVEDYETAIRRVIREAGQYGLRVTEEADSRASGRARDGTRKVDYESGHSRRLDTAARMNVLDGVRHLNQSIMEEVGRQFGADGVEIDAHMLCAEDHLPYQGQQFSSEEFEQIQDGLDRPFGEWNCRHSWHPILLGISPRTYADGDLERFARYSTGRVEIDGRSRTRYEWSQVMRRMETAIRQKKDTATLAAAAGDAALRRECQGSVNALVKEYERLSDRTGMGPDFRRTYVAGFRDVKTEVSPSEHERERLKSSYPNSVATKALDAPGYLEKFQSITDNEAVNRSIHDCAVKTLLHRNGTTGEDLYLINGKTGEVLHANTGSTAAQTVRYDTPTLDAIKKAHSDDIPIIALHNHPNGMPPSLDDGSSAFAHGYTSGVVVGHNLEVYSYSASDKAYDSEHCKRIHDALSRRIGFEFDFDDEIWYNTLRKFGMEVRRQ